MITDGELVDRVDVYLAVQRALNAAERAAFMERRLVGSFEGAQAADWIAEAVNADAFVALSDRWWQRSGDKAVAYLRTLHQLPEPVVKGLLGSALYVVIGIGGAPLVEEPWAATCRRSHVEIASGAALWVLGRAEQMGWQPPQ